MQLKPGYSFPPHLHIPPIITSDSVIVDHNHDHNHNNHNHNQIRSWSVGQSVRLG